MNLNFHNILLREDNRRRFHVVGWSKAQKIDITEKMLHIQEDKGWWSRTMKQLEDETSTEMNEDTSRPNKRIRI